MTGIELDLSNLAPFSAMTFFYAAALAVVSHMVGDSDKRPRQILGIVGLIGATALMAPLVFSLLTADSRVERRAAETREQLEEHYDVSFAEPIDLRQLLRSGTLDVNVTSTGTPGESDIPGRLLYDDDSHRVTLERTNATPWASTDNIDDPAPDADPTPEPTAPSSDRGIFTTPDATTKTP